MSGVYGFVDGVVACPGCKDRHDITVFVHWGLCAPGGYNNGLVYRVGDLIHWRADYDQPPQANVLFTGPNQMRNIGDPARLNVHLIDALRGPKNHSNCPHCGTPFLTIVEITRGAVAAITGCRPGDPKLIAALDLDQELEQVSLKHVTWNHGVADKQLTEVMAFLGQYDFSSPELAYGVPTSEQPKYFEAQERRRLSINAALLRGCLRFSRRLLCHGVANATGLDPFLLDLGLSNLLTSQQDNQPDD